MNYRAALRQSTSTTLIYHKLDIAIFGGGIAGLWTLARLRQAGYRVALFERRAIGGIQSMASQGIIHGGTKYALTGKLTGSAMAIGAMPGIWRAALDGAGEVDLRGVRVLASHQHLWSTGSLACRQGHAQSYADSGP
jgi:glycerol-3-phosphate dehydrogenase